MGADCVGPFLEYGDRLSFLLCLTSNPGADDFPAVRGRPTSAPSRSYPTTLAFPEAYGRAWDATAAVLASRGFPLTTVARDTGVLTTGWKVTQPNHQVEVAGRAFVGRKAERLTVLLRPVAGGTEVTVSSQSALVSPQWSAAGAPPPGQVLDLDSDTVTEYGVLYDVGRILGHRPELSPDRAYAAGLSATGVFAPAPLPGKEVSR